MARKPLALLLVSLFLLCGQDTNVQFSPRLFRVYDNNLSGNSANCSGAGGVCSNDAKCNCDVTSPAIGAFSGVVDGSTSTEFVSFNNKWTEINGRTLVRVCFQNTQTTGNSTLWYSMDGTALGEHYIEIEHINARFRIWCQSGATNSGYSATNSYSRSGWNEVLVELHDVTDDMRLWTAGTSGNWVLRRHTVGTCTNKVDMDGIRFYSQTTAVTSRFDEIRVWDGTGGNWMPRTGACQ